MSDGFIRIAAGVPEPGRLPPDFALRAAQTTPLVTALELLSWTEVGEARVLGRTASFQRGLAALRDELNARLDWLDAAEALAVAFEPVLTGSTTRLNGSRTTLIDHLRSARAPI